jgi:prespore-specific regulator
MKGRRWTEQEDQLLREKVLESISNGGTQLEAFEEVGRKLGRTSGACGFRWNAVLRRQDPLAYTEAKKKRVYQQIHKKKVSLIGSFPQIIESLKQVEKSWNQLQEEIRQLSARLAEKNRRYQLLVEENKKLKEEKNSYEWYQQEVKERYQDLLQILKRVREESSIPLSSEMEDENVAKIHADTDSSSSS